MRPIAHAKGDDAPGSVDEGVPRVAAVIEDVFIGFEDAVRKPVISHELPDVLLWVEFRAFGRQRHNGDVLRDCESAGEMPAGLINEQGRVRAGRDVLGDFGQVQVHRLRVAARQDEPGALALFRADRAEDVGRRRALVLRRARPRAALGPSACDLVLLADAGFVAEPDLYVANLDALLFADCLQACGEVFLKSSMAPAACA
jgi:hypothetical protein